ncbi:RNB domain-containing ribonuclease [Brucepastera parasyntrophica]|uniref:RNB domain-containing ribonuclease n=1 Tax=Brucepastera parasyntrophica TaxID=2880008 RepID=UPI00210D2701|nr:RNB domain-containing ribonuclease [Brucepastera parasyntrophica]ULQ59691.1 RNB domain-containing ribonuclease [Brucepastera parasyntrophica]
MQFQIHTLVLYKSRPAIVIGLDNDKIEIQLAEDVKKVRNKDIVFLHAGPVRNLQAVLSAELPPGEPSDALDFFENENPSYAELTELIWGSYPPEAAWVIWEAVASSPFFICEAPSEPVTIRSKDEIAAGEQKLRAKQEEELIRADFAGRLEKTLAGQNSIRLPDDSRFLQEIEGLALGSTAKSRILKEAGIQETPQKAHRTLLLSGFWPAGKNPWPSRRGHTISSPKIPVPPPDSPGNAGDRLDLTHFESWAIDNEWSSDPDDAISFDGEKLWVHIADPAETVLPGSPSDNEARKRGSTLYIPEGAARMLSENALEYYALGLSAPSYALSFCISLGAAGTVEDVAVHRSLVRVQRITYREAYDKREKSSFASFFSIAERNIQRRQNAGAVFIDLPEIHISVTDPLGTALK